MMDLASNHSFLYPPEISLNPQEMFHSLEDGCFQANFYYIYKRISTEFRRF